MNQSDWNSKNWFYLKAQSHSNANILENNETFSLRKIRKSVIRITIIGF